MTSLNYLIIRSGGGDASAWQGNLIEIFNITNTLLSKGFESVSEEVIESTLLGESANHFFSDRKTAFVARQRFIKFFNDKNFRNEIKKRIYTGAISNDESASQYDFEKSEVNELRFTKTVELLIAFLCVKELKAYSASFGVKINGTPHGGDYDCIANFQNLLVYFEVKSGKKENISSETLQCFLDRHNFLAPHFSVLFMDYEGGIDKLDEFVRQFRNLKVGSNRVTVMRKILSGTQKFYVIASDVIVVDIHKGSILSNLRLAMQYIHRYNAYNKNMSYINIPPNFLGYEYDEL